MGIGNHQQNITPSLIAFENKLVERGSQLSTALRIGIPSGSLMKGSITIGTHAPGRRSMPREINTQTPILTHRLKCNKNKEMGKKLCCKLGYSKLK